MQRQRLKEAVRAHVRVPAELLVEIDRLAEASEVSRATIITRLLREGVRRAGAKEAA